MTGGKALRGSFLGALFAALLGFASPAAAAVADLTIVALSGPSTAAPRQVISFTNTVKNLGPDAAGHFFVDYFLATVPDYALGEADYTPLGDLELDGLAANATYTNYVTFQAPSSTGAYYVIAVADPSGSLIESREDNNQSSKALTVTSSGGSGGGSGQDLSVTTVTAPASAAAGQTISIGYTVQDIGSEAAGTFSVYYYLSADRTLSPATDAWLGMQTVSSLASGSSYSGSPSLTVPFVPAGPYYVLVVASASETNQDDNVLASSTMTVSNDVNLTVTALSAPASAVAGEVLTATDTVRNGATSTTAGTFRVGYYLSSDGTFSADDVLLGYRVVASLAPGASDTDSLTATVPSVPQGDYTVIAVADALGEIAETSEADDSRPAASPTSVSNSLDLRLTAVSAAPAATVGQQLAFSDTVANVGTSSTGPFHVAYYLSSDASFSPASDVLLGTRLVASLGGGASSAGSVSFTVPASAPRGSCYAIAVADPLNEVSETSEANNWLSAASPTTVSEDVDLVVDSVDAPASASLGQPITLGDTVRNAGASPAGSFQVGYYLSTGTAYSPAYAKLLGYRTVDSLAAGAGASGTVTVTVSTSVAQGSYYVLAVADAQDSVVETSEGNNARASSSRVSLTANADLILSTMTVPGQAVSGGSLSIADTVQDIGIGGAGQFAVSYYLSVDASLSPGTDIFLGSRTVASLAAGASSSRSASVAISSTVHGSYFVLASADSGGSIVETDETNNVLATPEPIQIRWPVPATPAKPAGRALGSTSIAWGWTPLDFAQRYYVYPSTSGAELAQTVSTQAVQGGLSPNTTGSVRVLAANVDGAGPSSPYGDPVYTLAEPPAGLTASKVSASSVSLSWSLGANPPGTLAQVHRSTDGTHFSQVLSTSGVSIADVDLLGCTPYWYRVRNVNGDGLASDFGPTADFLTAGSTPSAPSRLDAASLAGGSIALSWGPSPSEGIAQYRLYSDGGSGTVDYGTPLAVFSSTVTGWTAGALTPGQSYAFGLRAVNRCGVEEANTGVAASAASLAALSGVRTAVKSPQAGQRVWGDRITVAAEPVLGEAAQVRRVLFQVRPAGGAWTDIVPAESSHPNPALSAPFFVHWDPRSAGAGVYELRAVATDLSGNADASPPGIGVVVDPADPELTEASSGGGIRKDQKLSNSIDSTVEAGAPASGFFLKLTVPSGALSASTATLSVADAPSTRPAPPPGAADLGLSVQLSLSNGQTQLSSGRTATVTLSYPDADGDGVVDGTTGRVDRLRMYSAETAAGPWTPMTAVADASARTFTGLTTHFSFFGLFSAAAADLGSIRVYPNPYKPNDGDPDTGAPYSAGNPDSGIVFDNLPKEAEIRILTLTGQEVVKLVSSSTSGKLQWDGRNSAGRDAASGLYFAVISSSGQGQLVKKLLIVR